MAVVIERLLPVGSICRIESLPLADEASSLSSDESPLSLSSHAAQLEFFRDLRDPVTSSKSGLNGCSWTEPIASVS